MELVLVVLAAVAVVTAVLARRAATRAATSERRYRALTAQSPDLAIGLVDRELKFALFEGEALARYWSPSEVVGRALADVIPAERIPDMLPAVEAALAGESRRITWVGLRSGKNYRIDVVPFREHGDRVDHAMLAIRDVSEETALQRTLEEQSGFLSAVLTQLRDSVTVCDADGKLLEFGNGYGLSTSAFAIPTAGRSDRTRRHCCARCAGTSSATSRCTWTGRTGRWRCWPAADRSRPRTAARSAPSSSTPT
jgi:PAS domain S-box-containing protein